MIASAALLAAGLSVLKWRPCARAAGRAPRATIALLLSAAAAVWVGSFGMAVSVASGTSADVLAACGELWRHLLRGQAAWWQVAVVATWAVVFPVRGVIAAARSSRSTRTLTRNLIVACSGAVRHPRVGNALLVDGLTTPAVTLGVVRPKVFVDSQFWAEATSVERDVVLRHEAEHMRARHGAIDVTAQLLLAALAPLPLAGAHECVRGQLEALADDAAASAHDGRTVGLVLGRVALAAAAPSAGLGAASGSCLWRVQRLVGNSAVSWKERTALVVAAVVLVSATLAVTADAAVALGPVLNPDYCPL